MQEAVCSFCQPDLPEFEQLMEERDDELFDKIKYNPNQTLHQLLPAQSMASQLYDLRDRTHDRQLKASVEEPVNVHRSEIEKNAFKVFKLKQLVSCLILTLSSQEKDH